MQETIIPSLTPGMVAVLGVPWDSNSSYLRGPALAPAHIRQALHSGAANYAAEDGTDLSTTTRWVDVGDMTLTPGDEALGQMEDAATRVLATGAQIVALGGDHSVTYPLVRAHAKRHPGLTIFHIDAHADLYDHFAGNRWSHASPFARIMEERLVSRLVQVGIRTLNAHQREQAARFGVEIVEMRDWQPSALPTFAGPLYLSLDLDALDPACAPGVSHHEPGGLLTRDILQMIQQLTVPLIGADIVELNPLRDIHEMTAMVAAKFLKELVAKMLAA